MRSRTEMILFLRIFLPTLPKLLEKNGKMKFCFHNTFKDVTVIFVLFSLYCHTCLIVIGNIGYD